MCISIVESIDVFDTLRMLVSSPDVDIENLFCTRPTSLVRLMRRVETPDDEPYFEVGSTRTKYSVQR